MSVPREPGFDHSAAFLREGYGFVGNRCARFASDSFETRLMLRPVLCLTGPEGAALFYGTDLFTRRHGALPPTTVRLLQDKGSVMLLDGAAHHHRKRMFLDLLSTDEAVAGAAARMRERWLAALPAWSRMSSLSLFAALGQVLTEAMLLWVGLPIDGRTPRLAVELTGMVEDVARIGPKAALALYRRARCERWARGVIRRIRAGRLALPDGAPARAVAGHRSANGELLSLRDAGVELLNLLRPAVAVRRYIVFAAMALEDHPDWRGRFARSDEGLEGFVEEVRRLYPFIPVMGGVALRPFTWRGQAYPAGQWVLLDIYGTNRDAAAHADALRFDPARRQRWRDIDYAFIPQGGGPAETSHRCPGEHVTVALMAEAVRLLTRAMRYTVPPQDLSIDLGHIPAMAASGFRIAEVSARTEPAPGTGG